MKDNVFMEMVILTLSVLDDYICDTKQRLNKIKY